MSAYAALQEGEVFTGEDDGIIMYSRNSSDDEEIEMEQEQDLLQEVIVPASINPVKSSFNVNDDNVIFHDDYIIIGLKVDESITISGQFKLYIERGAILINGVHYYHAPQRFEIIQPSLSSLPIISSTQVVNTNEVNDVKTLENEHLFSSDYKSVIKISCWSTGLENIGKYHSPFKNLFRHDDNSLFLHYSFDVKFQLTEGIQYDKTLVTLIQDLTKTIIEPSSFITIGNKNSGKSTISKLLINELVKNCPVSVLDLDPGQSEYSKPYCLSITNHYNPIFGYNYYKDLDDVNYFYGFTTPQQNPESYFNIIENLLNHYTKVLKPRGFHLVINTPGWVKGYGKELLINITKLINPDNLILLTSNSDQDDILNGLTYKTLTVGKGYFIQSKYSPAEIRNFNKLSFFHNKDHHYNFDHHLLDRSPLKVSYQTNLNDASFMGVNLVSVLNHDAGLNINLQDLPVMMDCSMVGYYLIDNEYFQANLSLFEPSESSLYLNSSNYYKFIEYNTTNVMFKGICIVHSINVVQQYYNLYFPYNDDINDLKQLIAKGYKLLLVKGESDIPSCEILMPTLIDRYQQRFIKAHKSHQDLPEFPYVSYNNKINGVWKVRRNIMRRGHGP